MINVALSSVLNALRQSGLSLFPTDNLRYTVNYSQLQHSAVSIIMCFSFLPMDIFTAWVSPLKFLPPFIAILHRCQG